MASASHSPSPHYVVATLGADGERLTRLREKKRELELSLSGEFSRLSTSRGTRDAATAPSEHGASTSYESLVRLLGKSRILHHMEADLRFQGDIFRLKEDLRRSLTELEGLEPRQTKEKLKCFKVSIDIIQIICESFHKNKKREKNISNVSVPLSGGASISDATQSFLLSKCQHARRELERFLSALLTTKSEKWPPHVTVAKGGELNEERESILGALKLKDPTSYQLLCTTMRMLCILQKSYMDLLDEGDNANTGGKSEERLWFVDPLLDEFKSKICFHFGQHGGTTFRLDKPEWLLKYGLCAAEVYKIEGKALSSVIDGTGVENVFSIPQELVRGILTMLQKLLPQYLESADREDNQGQLPALLLHLANQIREYDLKFAELLNPRLRESFYCSNPFSPISAWEFGSLIGVLLRDQYFEDWLDAETGFLEDRIDGIFNHPESWAVVSEPTQSDYDGGENAALVGIPMCVEQLCRLLTEYINFSRSFLNEQARILFLDSVGNLILQSLFKKLSWRVDSYDPYGDTSRHLQVHSTTSCLASISYVEGAILDPSMYDQHTCNVTCFKYYAKEFIHHIKKWSFKLVKLLTKEFENRAIRNLQQQLNWVAEDKSRVTPDDIQMEYLLAFEDLLIQLREIRLKVSSDVFRTVWTSAAACVNTNLFNKVAIGLQHNQSTIALYVDLVSKCVEAFEEFTKRPRSYLKLLIESSQILSMEHEDAQALVVQIENLKESESTELITETYGLHSLSPLQVSQLIGLQSQKK